MALIWTLRSTPVATTGFTCLAWAPELGLFCAAGGSAAPARYATSPDGITWTLIATGGGAFAAGIVWTGTAFVALGFQIGTTACVQTSPDGVTWTTRAGIAAGSSWQTLAYAPSLGRVVAVGPNGQIMTSDNDGVTWTARTSPATSFWCALAWSPDLGRFSCLSQLSLDTTRGMYSPDGITWTGFTGLGSSRQWRDLAWSPTLGLFAAVDGANNFGANVATSPDGITYTIRTTPSGAWNSIAWAAGPALLVAVGGTGGSAPPAGWKSMSSPDGLTWTAVATPADVAWEHLVWSPGRNRLVAVATGAAATGLVMTGAPPTVTRVIPAQGRTTGGRLVRITGTAFSGTPVVTFGGVAATSITVVSPTRITARTPAHAAGPVDVVVGSATLVDGFLYTDAMFGDLRIRRPQGILVDDTLNDAPNSATLRCERVGSPAAPALGAPVQLVDPASGALLFGGTALVVTDGIDGRASNPGYRDLKAGDLAWRFNAVRPFGTWTERPADVVAQELIDTFAPAFTGVIAAGLPTISLVCNRSQTLSEVFSAIAALIGGSWYPDDAFGIHLFLTNPADPPDPITDVTPLYDPPPTVTRDLSQVRNRIFVKGAGPGDAFQEAVHPPTIDNMDVTPTTGGAIPNGTYEYSMTAVTAGGEGVPESLGYGGILDLLPSANTAFALADLDLTVSPDVRVVGRKLYRNRSVEDPTVPHTTNCVTRQYLITTLGNTAGIGEDTFFDGKADAELTQLAPNLDTTASIFVEVEDTAAQAYLAGLLNVDGGDDDGVRDGYVLDANLTTFAMATARAEAELALWAYPVETVVVAARDEKLVSGQSVAITLTNPAIAGTFKIQHVQIDQVAIDATGMLFPRRTITASSVRYTLDDLLRDVLLTAGGTGGGGGSGSSSGSGGSGGGTPPVPTYVEDLTSQIGGTAFTIARVFTQIAVYKNGLRLRETDDYTVTGPSGFTMAIAPVTGDCVLVEYR